MFDFIEESIPKEETKASNPDIPLEGMVYTMPSHRTTPASSGGHGAFGLITGIIGVLLVVCGTGVAIWWFEFRQTNTPEPAADVGSQEQPVVVNPSPQENGSTQGDQTPPESSPLEATSPDNTSPDNPIPPPTKPSVMSYVRSIDTDGDDLTDAEEDLFTSDSLQPDTDQDGHLDGEEVKFLYDPARIAPAKLETGSSVAVYPNPGYSYKLLYPSAWVVDSVDNARREVIFSSATGEFISITAQDNTEKLSALDWYSTVYQPNVDTSTLETMTYDTWTGVMSSDGREVYITSKDDQSKVTTPYVYVLKYDLGSKNIMSFGSVFQMMIRSFLISDLSF